MRVEIDHVAIRTTEFDKARAFFEDVFSMQCYSAFSASHRSDLRSKSSAMRSERPLL